MTSHGVRTIFWLKMQWQVAYAMADGVEEILKQYKTRQVEHTFSLLEMELTFDSWQFIKTGKVGFLESLLG